MQVDGERKKQVEERLQKPMRSPKPRKPKPKPKVPTPKREPTPEKPKTEVVEPPKQEEPVKMKPLYEENDYSPAEPTDDVLRAQDAEEFKGEVYE